MKKKLMIVMPCFRGGGAEKVVSNLINNININKFKLTVVSIYAEDTNPFHQLDLDYYCLNKKRLIYAIPSILKIIWKKKPSVIFSSLIHVNIFLCLSKLLKLYRGKLIIREANMPSRLIKDNHFFILFYKYFYLSASQIICSSYQMKDEFIKIGLPLSMITVIFNPVDQRDILSSEKINKFKNNKLNIISVGRLTHQKGYDRLINWFSNSKIENSHLTIIGNGELKESLSEQITKLGLSELVSIEDFSNDIYSWIYSSDILIMYSRWEGMPNVVLEALALGTYALVCHESGAVSDILKLGAKNMNIFSNEAQLYKLVTEYKLSRKPIKKDNNLPKEFFIENVIYQFENILLKY